MRKLANILIVSILLIGLSSCYTRRNIGLLQERKGVPTYEKDFYHSYRLRKNDELTFRIITSNQTAAAMFGNTQQTMSGQNNQTYKIFDDGSIDVPFLSHIPLEGLTLEEAENFLTIQLRPFVPDARVKLALSTSTFCVIGDAARGYFPIYKERLTIFQALALSGGLHESGDYGHVKIIRETNDGTKIVSFDLRSKSLIDSEFYYVYPNDIIYVDITKKRFWAVNSYSGFLSIISSSLTLLMSVWTLVK